MLKVVVIMVENVSSSFLKSFNCTSIDHIALTLNLIQAVVRFGNEIIVEQNFQDVGSIRHYVHIGVYQS